MPENILFVTICDDKFAPYLELLLASIKEHNPWFREACIAVLHNAGVGANPFSATDDAKLNQAMAAEADSEDAGLCCLHVDAAPYERFFKITKPELRPSLLKLACFSKGLVPGPDKLIFIDADMLCLGPLDELLSLNEGFAAVPSGKDLGKKVKLAGTRQRAPNTNGGMFVVDRGWLGPDFYDLLLKQEGGPLADQDVVHQALTKAKLDVFCLHPKWNWHSLFHHEKMAGADVRLLHFAGPQKPLDLPEEPRMRIWFEERRRLLRR